MSNNRCHCMNTLIPSPMDLQPQACRICDNQFMPSYQTLTCAECNVSICLECALTFSPETAFPIHLAVNGNTDAIQQYKTNRSCAFTLFRDPYMASVHYEYQRFYNTNKHIRLLEERVNNIKQEIKCIMSELASTDKRLIEAKTQLQDAYKRRNVTQNGQCDI